MCNQSLNQSTNQLCTLLNRKQCMKNLDHHIPICIAVTMGLWSQDAPQWNLFVPPWAAPDRCSVSRESPGQCFEDSNCRGVVDSCAVVRVVCLQAQSTVSRARTVQTKSLAACLYKHTNVSPFASSGSLSENAETILFLIFTFWNVYGVHQCAIPGGIFNTHPEVSVQGDFVQVILHWFDKTGALQTKSVDHGS